MLLLFTIAVNAQDTLRVLAIGNSFSADALEHHFYPVCRSGGVEVVATNLYIPSCTLRDHLRHMQADDAAYSARRVVGDTVLVTEGVSLSAVMQQEPWDFVTLQQASHYSGLWSTYTPYLGALIDSIRSRCPLARVCWHQTWAYPASSRVKSFARYYHHSQQEMYDSIHACTQRVMSRYDIDVLIPTGSAIQQARQTSLGDTFNRDQLHLNRSYAQWLASLVWYRALTGHEIDLENGGYIPENVQPDTAKIILRCLRIEN